jgi:DNA sulfur modification protein DndE
MRTAPVETIRIDERGKNQMITLKKRTGLKHWNVLCRWAFCASLAEVSVPAAQDVGELSNVELTWATFAGRHTELFGALLTARCQQDGLGTDRETLAEQFRLHLHRGLTYLVGSDDTKDLPGFASLALRRVDTTRSAENEAAETQFAEI